MDTSAFKYQCNYCDKGFQKYFNLKRHTETIHNRIPAPQESDADSEESDDGSNHSEESMESSQSELSTDVSDEEMQVYDDVFNNFLNDLYCRVTEDIDNDTELNKASKQSAEYVIEMFKKTFSKEMTQMLIIICGMNEEPKYEGLFNKIKSYRSKDVEFPLAIKLAVRNYKPLFDEEIEKFIQRSADEEESDEEEGDEEESDEEESDDEGMDT